MSVKEISILKLLLVIFLVAYLLLEDCCENPGTPDVLEYCSLAEIHRKTVASAFWAGEVEAEWREGDMTFGFKSVEDRDQFMSEVDKRRAVSTYKHLNCSEQCKRRGMCKTISH